MRGEGGENCDELCLVTVHTYCQFITSSMCASTHHKCVNNFLSKHCFNDEIIIPTLLITEMQ